MDQIHQIKNWLAQQQSTEMREVNPEKKRGFIALFDGGSKADKIATAKMLGDEFNKVVHQISLSKKVSKYIGETEKNLAEIFNKAENKNWILFFDEADALFGKRSDIKDAHDKYANIEIAYLLQKAEHYSGLVIFSTQLKENINDSIVRRFHSVVRFPIV